MKTAYMHLAWCLPEIFIPVNLLSRPPTVLSPSAELLPSTLSPDSDAAAVDGAGDAEAGGAAGEAADKAAHEAS